MHTGVTVSTVPMEIASPERPCGAKVLAAVRGRDESAAADHPQHKSRLSVSAAHVAPE
jgi:hypothetical protein